MLLANLVNVIYDTDGLVFGDEVAINERLGTNCDETY